MSSVRLRYRHAVKVEAQAKVQATQRALARSQLVAAPPGTELLGPWRVIEMALTSNGPRTTNDASLDEIILFEAMEPRGSVVGRWICRDMRGSGGMIHGALMYKEAQYALNAKVHEGRRFVAEKRPLAMPARVRLSVLSLIAESVRASWQGYEMNGVCSTSHGDSKEFRAVRIDEDGV